MAAVTGTGDLTIALATITGSGSRGLVGAGDLSYGGGYDVTSAGVRGIEGVGALLLANPAIVSSGIRRVTGEGALNAPRPTIAAVTIVPDPMIWDTDNRAWGTADFVYSEDKPVMLVGNEFYQADAGVNFEGEPVRVTLSRSGLTIYGRSRDGQWKIDPTSIKEVTGMFPIISGVPGTIVKISVGSQESPNDPIRWEGPYDFIVGTSIFQDFTVSGRYLSVKFESSGQQPWELLSYDLDIERVGGR